MDGSTGCFTNGGLGAVVGLCQHGVGEDGCRIQARARVGDDCDDADLVAQTHRGDGLATDPDGRVVIIEEAGDGADAGFAEMDLRMLVLCGGRERSIDGCTSLAGSAGLSVNDMHTTLLGQKVIECVPGSPGAPGAPDS